MGPRSSYPERTARSATGSAIRINELAQELLKKARIIEERKFKQVGQLVYEYYKEDSPETYSNTKRKNRPNKPAGKITEVEDKNSEYSTQQRKHF